MSESITRYTLEADVDENSDPQLIIDKDPHGRWVRYSDHEQVLTAATQAREKAERERDVLLSRESEVLKISGLVKHTNVNDCSGCGCMGLTGPEAMTMVVEQLNQALASHKVFEARIKAMTYAHNSTLQRLAACEKGNAMYHEENARLDAQVAKLNRIIDGDESLASSRKESPAAVAEPLTDLRMVRGEDSATIEKLTQQNAGLVDALAHANQWRRLYIESEGERCGDAPGHSHTVPGKWDVDGSECAECAAWHAWGAITPAHPHAGRGSE